MSNAARAGDTPHAFRSWAPPASAGDARATGEPREGREAREGEGARVTPLPADRWRAVSPLLDQALELQSDARAEWLAALRRDQPHLASDLHTLLVEYDALLGAGFLEQPVSRPVLPIDPFATPLAGEAIGDWRLRSRVGQGGMGSVWLAERCDGRFDGHAAIKLLNIDLMGRAGEARFRREGSILARLRHPHIAQLVDAGVSSTGQPYLVLEHVDGTRIDEHCDARMLNVDARIRLFLDVLDAVAHAHASLIVHRDIKPPNVLVSVEGEVKLLDFGIAKLLDVDLPSGEAAPTGAATLTRDGGWALTPEFAAPEQVTGAPITTATDVYALGVLLYVLLTGEHPAGPASRAPADLFRSITDVEPPRMSDVLAGPSATGADALVGCAARRGTTADRLRRTLRGDLDTIVAKALKKHVPERYPSVTALAEDLRRYLQHEPIGARPDTLRYRTAKFLRRHTRGVAAAAGVVLLIAGLALFHTVRVTAERDRAQLEASKAARTSELLTSLLTGSDPYATPVTGEAGEPTVRALLDAGAVRVQKELADQPELQAEMLTVIGRVYERQGLHDKAQPLLERALALGRGLGEPQTARLAQSLNDLGVLLREKRDVAAATPLLEEALATRRRVLGPRHKDVAVSLVELGRAYSDRGQLDRAEPLLREALAIRREQLGEEHRETATSLSALGLLLRDRGDWSGAEPLLRQSLEISRKALGEQHANVGIAMSNVGLVVQERGDHPAAEALFRQALAIRRASMGATNPVVATTLNNLSSSLREQRKYEEAAAALDEAMTLARSGFAADHPTIAMLLTNRARVHLAQGDAASAAPLLQQALRIRERAFEAGDRRIASVKSLLGAAFTRLGRYAEAEPLLLDARAHLKERPGSEGRDARTTADRLATLYEAWGKPDKAVAYASPAAPPSLSRHP